MKKSALATMMGATKLPQYSKTITLSGTGSIETDYILPLYVHYGSTKGTPKTNDIFLDSLCNTDFSDIQFWDDNGNRLEHYLHSYGNYEIIHDTKLGVHNIIKSNGNIVACEIEGITTGIAESADNGNNWTVLFSEPSMLLGVDTENDYYFIESEGNVYRSVDEAHTTWNVVLNTDSLGFGVVRFFPISFEIDSNGTIFLGRYQGEFAAVIYRSLDNGATWEIVYDASDDPEMQHLHCVQVDPYTGYVYAGVDGSPFSVVRSKNATNRELSPENITWEKLVNSNANDFLFGDGWRMFANETSNGIITTVIKTTDDINFTSEIKTGQGSRIVTDFDGKIYLTTAAQYFQRYPQVLQRLDDSTWKTIYQYPYDSGLGNDGLRYYDIPGIPTGETESQLILGYKGANYTTARLYSGEENYQGMVYLKISNLPADGANIIIRYGNSTAKSISTINTFNNNFIQTGLLAHYKLEEGTGTSIVDSVSSKNGVLTAGTGEWDAGGKHVGMLLPYISLTNYSYKFNGDGKIIITGSDTDEDLQFTKNFTVCFWFKSENRSSYQWYVGKGANNENHWSISSDTGGAYGYISFTYGDTKTRINPGEIKTCDGGWHFVGVSISSDNTIIMMVDGCDEKISGDELDPVIEANTGLLCIGADENGNMPMTGNIDDVQIYNVALTAKQMRQIYECRSFADTEPEIT